MSVAAPREIGGLPVVRFAAKHRLAICNDEVDTLGYFLFGCDSDWISLTDTWHESIERAKQQAEFEYEGVTAEWQEPK